MKNPKTKIYISIIVLLFALFAIGIKSQQNECDCMKWKHFNTVIISGVNFEIKPDSLCITEGYRDGKIINKNL